MSSETWWQNPQFDLGQLENEETHVTVLRGREVNGCWEYAAVLYRYQAPTLLWKLKKGVFKDE